MNYLAVFLKHKSLVGIALLNLLLLTACGSSGSSGPSAPSLDSISISPATISIANGTTVNLQASANYSDQSTADITADVSWQSANTAIADISSDGLLSAHSEGVTDISASFDGVSTTISITITSASLVSIETSPAAVTVAKGNSVALVATGSYSDQTTQNISNDVSWVSSDPSLAAVNATGLVTANNPGQLNISASIGSISSSSAVTVTAAALVSISVTPGSAALAKGRNVALQATALYSDQTTQDVSGQVSWQSSNSLIAGVSAAGLVSAVNLGSSSISASLGSISGAATVTVTAAELDLISVTPGKPTIANGTSVSLIATGVYSDKTTRDITAEVSWLSSVPTIAAVTSGVVTAIAAGDVVISASLGALSGSSQLKVTPAVLVAISVTPGKVSMANGTSVALQATGIYSDQTTQNLNTQLSWLSDTPSIATVSDSGQVTASSQGVASISASLGAVTGVAIITVNPATLTAISVTPGQVSVASGTSKALQATGHYTDQSSQNLSNQVSWLSNDTAIAEVSAGGVVSGLSIGGATVTASMGAIDGSAVITVTEAVLTSLSITPGQASLANGSSTALTATGIYSDLSTQDLTAQANWSSNNTVAEVTQNGVVTALSVGTANISASFNGFNSASVITVTPATLASIRITPGAVSLANGTSVSLQATGVYTDNTTQNLTPQASWQSSSDAIAEVTQSGLVTANSEGVADITASFNGLSALSALTITPATLSSISVTPGVETLAAGTSVTLQATGLYSDQSTQNLTEQVSWQSSDNAIAVVTPLGKVTGLSIGATNISASLGAKSGTAVITVSAATLADISITPGVVSLAKGNSKTLVATGVYTDQSTQNLSDQVSWISNSAAAEVTQQGQVTALAIGVANISASLGGFSSSAVVTVTAATLNAVSITPGAVSLANGTSVTLQATGLYSDQSTQDLSAQASWQSDSGAAEVTQAGVVSGLSEGVATISASFGGFSGSAVITVTAATLDVITITPSVVSLAKGSSVNLQATGFYSDLSSQNITAQVSWQSADSGVADVTPLGKVTGLSVGTTSISVNLGAKSATAEITIREATLTGISVTPGVVSLAKGNTRALVATGVYTDNSTQNLTTQVSWISSNDAIAEVSASGLVTANAVGLSAITASLDGVSGVSTITVTPATLASISVTPSVVSLANGRSVNLQATGVYSDLSNQDLTTQVSWQSSNGAVIEVTPAGLATALSGSGSATISAHLNSISGSSVITATTATLDTITITPSVSTLAKGSSLSLQATGVYSDLSSQDLSSQVSWYSADSSIAEVTPAGLVTAKLQGSTTISASLAGVSGVSSLTVSAATLSSISVTPVSASLASGSSVALMATGIYSDFSSQDITDQVSWQSANTAIADVTPAGVVTALSQGTVSISANFTGVSSAVASITVTPATLTAISVTPALVSIAAGIEYQFVASGIYSDNSTQDLTGQVNWLVANGLIAEAVNNSPGLFVAKTEGSTGIAASLNGVIGSATMAVTAAILDHIEMSSLNSSLSLGSSYQLQLSAIYSNGSSQSVASQAVWQSADASIASVDANGLIDTHGTGSTTISAIFDGMTVSQSVTVTLAVLSSIEITPLKQSLPLGVVQQFSATGIYSDNTIQDITDFVTWQSSNTAVASIDNSAAKKGQCSTLMSGDTTISAQLGAVISNKAVNVSAVVLNSIDIFPNAATISTGFSQSYTARGHYSDGSTGDITDQVTWTSSNLLIAGSNNNQKAKMLGYNPGQVTVSAESGGVFGFASLSVNAATLSSITIDQAAVTIAKGTQYQYTATGMFSDGASRDISQDVIWASATQATATISNDIGNKGAVFGLEVGTSSISASFDSVSNSETLTVTAATLSTIALEASKTQIVVGEALSIIARGTYSDSSTQDITKDVTWQSSDTTVAAVSNVSDNKGRIVAYSAGLTNISAAVNGVVSSDLGITVDLLPDEPIGISAHASPNVILNNGSDSSQVSVTVQAAAPTGVITDGTLIDFTVTDNGSDTVTTVATVGGVASISVSSVNIGFISVKAQLQGSSFVSSTNIFVTDDFLKVITRSAFSDQIYSNGSYLAGSSFGVSMQNLSNRVFNIVGYLIKNGGVDLIAPVPGINFNGGLLPAGGYAWAIYILDTDISNNVVQAGFVLGDVPSSSGFGFLATYTPSGL
ncbi:MAG: Ig-like domain-containing protein [Gammaproteobacteria bacterium]|nr:Ig-like domain-containing protein [Gammaproteobacteria bacterium]